MITGAKLLVVQGKQQGLTMQLAHGEYIFGRGAECQIRPNSVWVSRQHCILRVTEKGVLLRDLGSRNGTLVNGLRVVEEKALAAGDQVQVGPLVFELRFDAQATLSERETPMPASMLIETDSHPVLKESPSRLAQDDDWASVTPPGE